MLEKHHPPAAAIPDRPLQKFILLVFIGMAASKQGAIDSNEPPGTQIATPSAWPVMALPALDSL
jgi:hypothetical protein